MTNKTFEQILGEKIRLRREQLSKTLADVEYEATISDGHLGKIELGKTSPTTYTFFKLCKVLQINANELFIKIENEMNGNDKDIH